jgi:mannose-6-phosphate isomerase-like protein (cupin superfamily)
MFINQKDDVAFPILNPTGEKIFELIGASSKSGDAQHHSLAVVTLPAGYSSKNHYHKEEEETYYILAGVAKMVIDRKVFILSPGQACLMVPPERHQITAMGEEELEFLAICAPAWTPNDSFYE